MCSALLSAIDPWFNKYWLLNYPDNSKLHIIKILKDNPHAIIGLIFHTMSTYQVLDDNHFRTNYYSIFSCLAGEFLVQECDRITEFWKELTSRQNFFFWAYKCWYIHSQVYIINWSPIKWTLSGYTIISIHFQDYLSWFYHPILQRLQPFHRFYFPINSKILQYTFYVLRSPKHYLIDICCCCDLCY